MAKKLPRILSLAAALAALMGGATVTAITPATANPGSDEATAKQTDQIAKG